MSIEQKLLTKLQPHADRIAAGSSNDFDYLPAVLFALGKGDHLLREGQYDNIGSHTGLAGPQGARCTSRRAAASPVRCAN